MKGETQFTPGPWSIEIYGDGDSLVIHSSVENRVCFMATPSLSLSRRDMPRIRANAALIAAAPDFYGAAVEVDVFDAPLRDDRPDDEVVPVLMTLGTIRKFNAALSRARGETKGADDGE